MKSIVFISCVVYHLATIVVGAQEVNFPIIFNIDLLLSSHWLSLTFSFYLFHKTDYNIDFDKIESYNGTDVYYKYTLNVVKKDGSNSIFIVDSTIDLLQDLDSSWMVRFILICFFLFVFHLTIDFIFFIGFWCINALSFEFLSFPI